MRFVGSDTIISYTVNQIGGKMVTLAQMAEAHLVNVQREIANLQETKRKVEEDIKRLTEYFEQGVKVLNESRATETVSRSQDVSSVFGG